jgi:hypothetical protein
VLLSIFLLVSLIFKEVKCMLLLNSRDICSFDCWIVKLWIIVKIDNYGKCQK